MPALLWPVWALALDVSVLQSRDGGVQERFVEALRAELKPDVHLVHAGQSEYPDLLRLEQGALIVAVGAPAARQALEHAKRPVLAVMLSSASAHELRERFPEGRFTAIVLDQPPRRQLALVRELLPQARAVGVLLGPQTRPMREGFERSSSELGLELHFDEASDARGVVPALDRLLSRSDSILTVPDPQVFNAQTARSLLLTAYRAGRPLFAYSAAAVEAGALAAVFSAPEDIARQAAEWLEHPVADDLPQDATPRYYRLAINAQVARSLGIAVPDERRILQALRERGV
ncbi:MAG: ABC transporter substrate binding protein [Halothiobacillaceae bacterium]|nr:ABC transporter substrate binding protein [Halothiobacillaceae bacterium]